MNAGASTLSLAAAAARSELCRLLRGTNGAALTADVLHASGPVTRLMPQKNRHSRNLLGTEGNASAASVEENDPAGQEGAAGSRGTVLALPFGQKVSVYPDEGLAWSLSVFAITAFLTPSVPLAVQNNLSLRRDPWHRLREANETCGSASRMKV